MALIDIILPYYGPLNLLQEAVRSVLDQDDPGWRLTVLDDAYPDASAAEWFGSLDDERVRYVRHEHNLGLDGIFHECLHYVESDLFVVMGQDDVMLPNYLRTVRAAHQACPEAAVIQPGVQVIDEWGNPSTSVVDRAKRSLYAPRVDSREVLGGEAAAASILRGNWTYFPSLCWRSKPVLDIGFRTGLSTLLDWALLVDLIERGESIVVDPQVCFCYRRHRSSASSVHALSGVRFAEERGFLLEAAERMAAKGWHRAAAVARRQTSSRINALTVLPSAMRHRNYVGARALTKHVLGVG